MDTKPDLASAGDQFNRVSRRLVLYVHGFDPRGPSPYYAMQAEDAQVEDARPDRSLQISPRRRRTGETVWTLNAVWPDAAVETEFVFLRWDDLVRVRWDRSLRSQGAGLMRWWRVFSAAGYLGEARRMSKTLFIGVIGPLTGIAVYLLAVALVIGLAGAMVGQAAAATGQPPAWGLVALVLLGLAPAGWRFVDSKVNLCWLSRGFLYMADLHHGRVEGIEARTEAFADRVLAAAAAGQANEIVVVGHSSGSLLAIGMLGRALSRSPDLGAKGPPVALITVGQCLPAYSKLGADPAFSADLARLVEAHNIAWLDITAPSDPGSAAGWHPLRFSAHEAGPERVTRRPPRFHLAMKPAGFRRLRRDPMAFHFQYLRSCDRPEVYDWFRLIAGPEPISAGIGGARR